MNFRPVGQKPKGWVTATLDITPLVDVIFQLLIFFFYTANFIQNPNIPVNLPTSTANDPSSDRKDKIITIKQDGKIFFEGQVMDIKDLKVRLAKIAAERPETKLLIRSDSASQVGRLIAVMEAARESGLRRFGIATKSKGGVPPGIMSPMSPSPAPSPPPMGPGAGP